MGDTLIGLPPVALKEGVRSVEREMAPATLGLIAGRITSTAQRVAHMRVFSSDSFTDTLTRFATCNRNQQNSLPQNRKLYAAIAMSESFTKTTGAFSACPVLVTMRKL
jgi:hypothetical protein